MIAALALLLTGMVLAWWSYRALGFRRYGVALVTALLGGWVVLVSIAVATWAAWSGRG